MAKDTKKELRNQVMYSIYVRNYSEEGTFKAVEKDLNRIKKLGVDVIWLMPIHPIGEVQRKGTLGSPYANKDYRSINPELGTLDDFKSLVDKIHAHDMKCIIDVVYNHTSPDSWLVENHPEWFYKKPDGSFGNQIGDWWDIVDLDFGNPELWDYHIESLKYWAGIIDGFRCDVAPLLPLDFWLRAREEVAEVKQDVLWLSESVEPSFTVENRARGMISLSDSEIFQAFDVSYEYDIFNDFIDYFEGKSTLTNYLEKVNAQEYIYPDNYVKLRYLENHDRARIKSIIGNRTVLTNMTAFIYFQKGMTLIYAGQEVEDENRPCLFKKDEVNWATGYNLSDLMSRLYNIKKNPIFTDSTYHVSSPVDDVVLATHTKDDKQIIGVFNTKGTAAAVPIDIPDGAYINLISNEEFNIKYGKLALSGMPCIFCTN